MRNDIPGPGYGNVINPKAVPVHLSCILSTPELNKLSRSIENALPNSKNLVVQFSSAYRSEGTSIIAFETAMVTALTGKRVLFIDATGGVQHPIARKLADAVTAPLDAFFASTRSFNDTLVCAEKTSFSYTLLNNEREPNKTLNNLGNLQEILSSLRPAYDLIVIDSVAILADAFGVALAKAVDGTILVVEAESTRLPVLLQAKLILRESGGNVIGAVLNNRKFYIPQRLYKWLYQRY